MTYLSISYACVSIVIGFVAGCICFRVCRGVDEDYIPILVVCVCVWLQIAIVWPVFLFYLLAVTSRDLLDDMYRK